MTSFHWERQPDWIEASKRRHLTGIANPSWLMPFNEVIWPGEPIRVDGWSQMTSFDWERSRTALRLVKRVGWLFCCRNLAAVDLVYQAYSSTPSLTPDDDVFHHLADVYAQHHSTMHLGLACKPGSPAFPNGTTNGAAWYPLTGGVQVRLNPRSPNETH